MTRWLAAGLTVSLIVNLLLVGFVAGRMSAAAITPPPPATLMWMMRALPEQRREALQPALRPHLRAMAGQMRALRRARRDLIALLEDEPLDIEALRGQTEALRRHMDAAQGETLAALIDVAERLSAAERRQLARGLRELGQHRPHPAAPRGAPPRP